MFRCTFDVRDTLGGASIHYSGRWCKFRRHSFPFISRGGSGILILGACKGVIGGCIKGIHPSVCLGVAKGVSIGPSSRAVFLSCFLRGTTSCNVPPVYNFR